jgi:hypothetical protein
MCYDDLNAADNLAAAGWRGPLAKIGGLHLNFLPALCSGRRRAPGRIRALDDLQR